MRLFYFCLTFALTFSVATETNWVGHIYLPVKIATKYRYIIMEGSQIVKWETLPSPRVLRYF